jgi:hypothetical protein
MAVGQRRLTLEEGIKQGAKLYVLGQFSSPAPHSEREFSSDPRALIDEPRLPRACAALKEDDSRRTTANLYKPPADRGKLLFTAPKREPR